MCHEACRQGRRGRRGRSPGAARTTLCGCRGRIARTRRKATARPTQAPTGHHRMGGCGGRRRRGPVRGRTEGTRTLVHTCTDTHDATRCQGGKGAGEGSPSTNSGRPSTRGRRRHRGVARGRTRRRQTDANQPTGGKRMKRSDDGPSHRHSASLTQGETSPGWPAEG